MMLTWRRLAIAVLLTSVGYFFGPDVAIRVQSIINGLSGAAI